jgi:hypothetical protein
LARRRDLLNRTLGFVAEESKDRLTNMSIQIVRLGSPRLKGEGLRLGTVRRPPRGVPKSQFPNLACLMNSRKLDRNFLCSGTISGEFR